MPQRTANPERFSPTENLLLRALPAAELGRLRSRLTLTALPVGEVLQEPGSPTRHCYFPVSGLVSLFYVLEDGRTAELAVVGNEGCVGIWALLGGRGGLSRAEVLIEGHAYRVASEAVLDEFHREAACQLTLLRYIQSLMVQIAQTAACNRHHSVEQQLCRWLLLGLDHVPGAEVRLTHERLASMLGVRRSGVTNAIRELSRTGLIRQGRGVIAVPDRAKLQAHACECYAAVRKETDRLVARQLRAAG